ncbi:RND transporter [Rhodocyclus purpureus]|nr:RND transporter [Rhodocyclus purpureus]
MSARRLQSTNQLGGSAGAAHRLAQINPVVAPAGRRAPLLAAIATLGVLGISGCAVGPDFVRPESTLPGQYAATSQATPSAAAASEAEAALIEADWWKHFQDPVLDDLLARSLERNADLRIAVARVEQAEALAREAGGALLPQIDLGANTNRSQVTTVGALALASNWPRVRDGRSAALSTSYELDFWGRVRRGFESVQASAAATRYARDAIRLSVSGMVARNYLALRAYDAQLAVAAESLASRSESLRLVQTRVDAGLSSPLELHQAEGALAATQAQIAGLRQQRELSENLLALLVGSPELKIAAGDLRQLPLPPVPPEGLPSSLVQARPDVRQAEETLVAANAGIGVAKAGYFPKFTLTGVLGSESKTLDNLFTSGAGTWSLGLGLFMPVLDFGRTTARVDQATAQQKQSLVAYQNTLQTAFKEVKDALVGLRENVAAETAQRARADAAEKALKLAQMRYEAGYSGYLEVLDAQRSSNDALQSFVGARQARLSAAVDLFKALGGGWQDPTPRQAVANAGERAAEAR